MRDSDHCKAAAYQPEHDCLVSQSDIDRIVQNEQASCPKDEHYEPDGGNHVGENSSAHGWTLLVSAIGTLNLELGPAIQFR